MPYLFNAVYQKRQFDVLSRRKNKDEVLVMAYLLIW